jgi:hypothetical protein
MNPYIKGALDPAAREVREQGALRLNELRSTQSQRDSFGGARGALLESQAQTDIDQGISDLYGRGYASAFESGADRWAQDRDAAFRESQGWQTMAQLFQDSTQADINNLMATGATDRGIRQAMSDFDYGQFVEGRDWDIRNLSSMLAALQGIQGSYTTQTVTKEKTSGGGFSQALGLAATVAGAFYTGGGSLLATSAMDNAWGSSALTGGGRSGAQ